MTLFGPLEAAQVREEQDAACRLGEQLRRRLGEHLGAGYERCAARHQQPREELGPHAALAAQHQRCGELRELCEALLGVGESTRASDRCQRDLGRGRRLGVAQGALDRCEQALQCNRLFQEIERADARRLDGRFDRAMARHHHHRHVELAARGPLLQQSNAIGVRHPDVKQNEVRARALADTARISRALGKRHLVPLVLQDLREELADADFIVDDEDLRHPRQPSRAAAAP